ncbi:hypothetical protein ACRALDRAFT_212562 [Sodiomyces alcalophilus JCM 7366]|uniref:uncharacterized protein n=1 Tax=Sodiomyces alcalophilus JCM 7366 TaxID=591952 RepID=UPI0039B546C8
MVLPDCEYTRLECFCMEIWHMEVEVQRGLSQGERDAERDYGMAMTACLVANMTRRNQSVPATRLGFMGAGQGIVVSQPPIGVERTRRPFKLFSLPQGVQGSRRRGGGGRHAKSFHAYPYRVSIPYIIPHSGERKGKTTPLSAQSYPPAKYAPTIAISTQWLPPQINPRKLELLTPWPFLQASYFVHRADMTSARWPTPIPFYSTDMPKPPSPWAEGQAYRIYWDFPWKYFNPRMSRFLLSPTNEQRLKTCSSGSLDSHENASLRHVSHTAPPTSVGIIACHTTALSLASVYVAAPALAPRLSRLVHGVMVGDTQL